MVLSTWNHIEDNQLAFKVLSENGSALDAIEKGINAAENNADDLSVGYGGLPDREGKVTLDACIMAPDGLAGSVTFLQGIRHPISVARKVMEETPHVILSGQGAQQFAIEQGFTPEDLTTPKSRELYKEWLKKGIYLPKVNAERHDTIGMLAIDNQGDISGGCSTSGLSYKMHGRVGDSPIIGAGLFVDNEVGAATATGMGELVLRTLGSFLVVELMRQGATAQEACEQAVLRIVKKGNYDSMQVGYIATDKQGNIGAYSLVSGFNYTHTRHNENTLHEVSSYVK